MRQLMRQLTRQLLTRHLMRRALLPQVPVVPAMPERRPALPVVRAIALGLAPGLLLASLAAEPGGLGRAMAQSPPNLVALRVPIKQSDRLAQALSRSDIATSIDAVERAWKQQYETYYGGQFTTTVLSIPQMQRVLGQLQRQTGQTSALIYAIPGDRHLDVILVPPNAAPIHRRITDANRAALNATIRDFRLGIVNPLSAPTSYLAPGQQLYQWLIAPLEPTLRQQNIQNLVFCLGTSLRSLPLAALHDGKKFLVENYSLGIIPAFNLLDKTATPLTNSRILAMGASQFQQLTPLPAVPLELSMITQAPWQGETWLNQDFTKTNLQTRRKARPFGIIHLATHADITSGPVEDSYIQFWDQRLNLSQIKALGLRSPAVQLLVLSACRTALGNPQAELGFAGLAVQSGAQAVIASLWSVSDVGTLGLMTELYRFLPKAPIKAQALQQAQRALLAGRVDIGRLQGQGTQALISLRSTGTPSTVDLSQLTATDFSHPYYWAGFTLVGNPW